MSLLRIWCWPGAVMVLLAAAAALTAGDANGAEVFARILVAMVAGLALGLASVLIASAFGPRKS